MTQRQQWTFPYTVADVLAGARDMLAKHEEQEAQLVAEAQRLTRAAEEAPTSTDGLHLLGDRMTVLEREHTNAELLHDYHRWVQALSVLPSDHMLALDMDDMLWFGIAGESEGSTT